MTGVIIGMLLAGGWMLFVRWWRRRPRRTRIVEECGVCGRVLSGRRVHLLVSRPDDDVEAELGGVGGTFVSVAFCSKHCPGGCTNRRCRAKLLV